MWISHTYLSLLIILMLSLVGCTSNKLASTPTLKPSPTITATAPPLIETIKGTFGNQIGILEDNMPRADSEKYVVPTESEQREFAKLVSMIFTDHLEGAVDLATENNYTLNYYVDRGDDYAMSYLLREQRPIQSGWGLYAI